MAGIEESKEAAKAVARAAAKVWDQLKDGAQLSDLLALPDFVADPVIAEGIKGFDLIKEEVQDLQLHEALRIGAVLFEAGAQEAEVRYILEPEPEEPAPEEPTA